ncbi:MAG: hypothetical protein RIS46_10 [Actinomycetota bacterium]
MRSIKANSGKPSQPRVACHTNILAADSSFETFPATLGVIAENGYSHVVLPPMDIAVVDRSRLKRVLSQSGLGVITYIGGSAESSDVGSAQDLVHEAGLERLRKYAEFTAEIGAMQMNGVPYGQFGHPVARTSPESFNRAARAAGAVADYAFTLGVTMSFEVLNRYETSMVNTSVQALEFVNQSESNNLKIHLDTFHMSIEEVDIAEAIRVAMPKLAYLELGQSARGLLSKGSVDIPRIISTAMSYGYTGLFGIEAFSRTILNPRVSDALSVWNEPYLDGKALIQDATSVIRKGVDLHNVRSSS